MKHFLRFFSVFFVCSSFFTVFASATLAQDRAASTDRSTFPIGEKLTYNISFATFPDAGFLELHAAGREKIDDREVNVVHARLRTNGTVQATLLDLDYGFTTFLAPDTHLPVRVQRLLRDDGKLSEVRRDFTENQTSSIINIHDVVSALYQIRRFDFSGDANQTIKVWQDERVIEARLQAIGRETIATAIGAMNTIVLQIRTKDEAVNRYKPRIYLSDDERRLPVLAILRLPRGEVRVELASAQTISPEQPAAETGTPAVQPTPVVRPTPRLPPPRPTPPPYVDNVLLDPALPFGLGEKLEFEVARGAQKIGTINLEIKERKKFFGRDGVRLVVSGQSSNNSGIFSPADKVESYIDPDYLVPFRQEIRLSGALAPFNQTLNFDQERGTATDEKGVQAQVPVGTHDILSFVYALRAFRFSTAKNDAQGTRAAIFLGKAPVIVTLRATRQTIDFRGKKVDAIALTAATGDPQIDSLNLRLWVSDDARRLPLKLIFNSPAGTIEANLVKY